MFFNIHPKTKIGYKTISKPELGLGKGGVTHIGLFANTIDFIANFQQQSFAQFIYEDSLKELLSFLDPITNPDGSIRSPKIRSGDEAELNILGIRINSVVREIRGIASRARDDDWYLMWFGLENKDLVFFLIKAGSKDYSDVSRLIGGLDKSGVLEFGDGKFEKIIKYLNKKINNLNLRYIQELELVAQTGGDKISSRIVPRRFDIEKAQDLFKEIGKKGEALVNQYLTNLKKDSKIKDFDWVNKIGESGMPYDFEITNNQNNKFYSDVKSTGYKFEQEMIFSGQELKFINQNNNYLIHRVFDLNSSPKLKVCNNITTITDEFVKDYNEFDLLIRSNELKINSLKIQVPPILKRLKFEGEISLAS